MRLRTCLKQNPARLGSVVLFAEGVTVEQAEAALAELVKQGIVVGGRMVDDDSAPIKVRWDKTLPPAVHEYDPEYGEPVWYIP